MLKKILVTLLLLSSVFISCSLESKEDKVCGTVVYVESDGGFYGIVTDDDKNLKPINLDAEFQEEGLRIRFDYKEPVGLADPVLYPRWGIPVELNSVEAL